jgi:restriction system protein
MPIPDFQTLMLPLLHFCADGKDHIKSEVVPALAEKFGLTEAELAEDLPKVRQGKFYNRVAWAQTYLKQAGLLEITGRGLFRITERGKQVLSSHPVRIDMKFLEQYPEYIAFRNRGKNNKGKQESEQTTLEEEVSESTPEELLEAGYRQLRSALASELLQQVKSASPAFFEHMVVELLLRMGYGGTQEDAGAVVSKSGDGGIDGIINEDRLGLDVIYIQAKRWEADVGRPEIQKFVGALAGNKASKGVFITSSGFTKEARNYANQVNHKVVLMDGVMLAELMMDYDLGVSTKDVFTVKRLDSDYFDED